MNHWTEAQADLLMRLYREAPVDESACAGPSLDALVTVGFAMLFDGRVMVTLAGKQRAAELLRAFS